LKCFLDSGTWYSIYTRSTLLMSKSSNAVFAKKKIICVRLHEANNTVHVWCSRTSDGVQWVHFPDGVTIIMDIHYGLMRLVQVRVCKAFCLKIFSVIVHLRITTQEIHCFQMAITKPYENSFTPLIRDLTVYSRWGC
jgi:hypothetical protein